MASAIKALHNKLKNKEISCVALVQEKLDQLKASDYNTANYILDEYALNLAQKVDQKIANGQSIGLLEGIPFGVKDVYLLQGTYSTASSDLLRKYKSPYTATAIQKLLDAGAIPVVKENCDSFGHGSSNENTVFGPVKNALDKNKVAGGSSGGSAVNVAKNFTTFSIGGDTGGSIRQPAGYNNVYGLKPTYGKISRYGLMAYASSTDCVGPIAQSLEDTQIVLNVMSGSDYRDQTTFDSTPVSNESLDQTLPKGTKIGYYKNFIESDALHPAIKADFKAMLTKLEAEGMEIVPLDFFDASILVSTYYALAMAETASNLARLDGTNYGVRTTGKDLKEGYSITRSENFTAETKRRIVGGNQVLSQGHSEEIYNKAQQLRQQISHHFDEDFKKVDVVLSPVTPNPVPQIGNNLKDPMTMYLSDAYTVGFSLGGLPTLTAPLAMETGVQITAAKKQEAILFTCANFLKQVV
ncbi:amidase [Aquimarina agarilytica]|uniref:amidase n=1 Tax=Aquimarina agarilytica TaxID=1087449 RepID=UPI000287E2B3|nr:amidase [Aquimarina agarilytica]